MGSQKDPWGKVGLQERGEGKVERRKGGWEVEDYGRRIRRGGGYVMKKESDRGGTVRCELEEMERQMDREGGGKGEKGQGKERKRREPNLYNDASDIVALRKHVLPHTDLALHAGPLVPLRLHTVKGHGTSVWLS